MSTYQVVEKFVSINGEGRRAGEPIRGIANEAKSIPREWINAHGNDIRQELYNYLYPLIQGEVSLTYQNGVPVYMPVPHLKPDHVS